jgi:hypothetical protein
LTEQSSRESGRKRYGPGSPWERHDDRGDPTSGKTLRSIHVAAHAGTAFDGQHLFQIAEDRIQKIDPQTGHVLATIPAPGGGGDSGLAWAEGTLWVGQYRDLEWACQGWSPMAPISSSAAADVAGR